MVSTVGTRHDVWTHPPVVVDRRRRVRRRWVTAGSTRDDGDERRVRLLREAYEKLPIREVVDDVSRALEVRR